MHIAQLVPLINSIVSTLAMAATWTPTVVDDVLVKIFQVILKSPDLMDELIALIDQHQELAAAKPELSAPPAVLDGTINSVVTEPMKETHEALTLAVKERFEGRSGQEAARDTSKIRAILAREKIDWAKWMSYLPVIAQMIMALLAKK